MILDFKKSLKLWNTLLWKQVALHIYFLFKGANYVLLCSSIYVLYRPSPLSPNI